MSYKLCLIFIAFDIMPGSDDIIITDNTVDILDTDATGPAEQKQGITTSSKLKVNSNV